MSNYITKSNPNIFQLQDFLRTLPEEARWTICRDAQPGDELVIGLSGEEAGIYATAVVVSTPVFGGEDPDFWISIEEAAKPRWRADIKISENLIAKPILEKDLSIVPELKRITKWLRSQGASCHITEEETVAIRKLISKK